MPKAEILKIMDAIRLVIATCNISDEEAQALFVAAAKATRRRRNRKVEP